MFDEINISEGQDLVVRMHTSQEEPSLVIGKVTKVRDSSFSYEVKKIIEYGSKTPLLGKQYGSVDFDPDRWYPLSWLEDNGYEEEYKEYL